VLHSFPTRRSSDLSKIINLQPGYLQVFNTSTSQFQTTIKIVNVNQILQNCTISKLCYSKNQLNYLLNFKNLIYRLNYNKDRSLGKQSTNLPINFTTLITNQFKTLTGGIVYYTQEQYRTKNYPTKIGIHFYEEIKRINHQTVLWLAEETYLPNCDNNFLLVATNNFIPEKFEIIPNHFSKTSGLIKIIEKKNSVQEINIQSGSLYEVVNLENVEEFTNQVFYPGEFLLNHIEINQPSFIEVIDTGLTIQLLIRPLEIYETPLAKSIEKKIGQELTKNSILEIKNLISCPYPSNQKIKQNNSLDLITDCLNLIIRNSFKKISQLKLDIKVNSTNKLIKLITSEELFLTQYIPANLKYTDINLSLIVKNYQFVNAYSTLGYLQVVTDKSLELVKLKSKNSQKKQIFLISNDDCITLSKNKIKDKTINQLLINPLDVSETGKIIIDNGKVLTIQKGRPYFFPNCKNDSFIDKTILQYKLVSSNLTKQLNYKSTINIHCYDITNKLISVPIRKNKNLQFAFSKMIIKKQGKFYISGIPIFLRELLIGRKNNNSTILSNLKQIPLKNKIEVGNSQLIRNSKHLLFIQKTDLKFNTIKSIENRRTDFASLLLLEYPIPQIGITSVPRYRHTIGVILFSNICALKVRL
jgi:hypothetical protein